MSEVAHSRLFLGILRKSVYFGQNMMYGKYKKTEQMEMFIDNLSYSIVVCLVSPSREQQKTNIWFPECASWKYEYKLRTVELRGVVIESL